MTALSQLDLLIGYLDTSHHLNINCDRLASILVNNIYNFKLDPHALKTIFSQYKYNKQHLIDDLCDILFCKGNANVSLFKILTQNFNIKKNQLRRMYEVIMYDFLKKEDINNCNFIKMLIHVAFATESEIDVDGIKQIATENNLTGSIFIKEKTEFINALKFAKLFKTVTQYNKKQYVQIWRDINKWKPLQSTQNQHNSKRMQIIYSFGIKYWYKEWKEKFATNEQENVFIQSHFKKFKEEVTDTTGKILLDVKRWNNEMKIAESNQILKKCKERCRSTKCAVAFNINADTLIEIDHLIAVQLYCNFTAEQERFSKTYRMERYNNAEGKIEQESLQNVAEEHSYYANWGRLLYEAVNVFGNRQWEQKYFIHGINKEMLFKKTTSIHIYGPLSTTLVSNKRIAIDKFAGENGMAIKVDASMNNCFHCEWISDFYDEEKEFLFIGSPRPFRITNVWIYRHSWCTLGKYVKAINRIIEPVEHMNDKIDWIKDKLLEIKHELTILSREELQKDLNKFASSIIVTENKDDKDELSAVEWVIRLFHCYLHQY